MRKKLSICAAFFVALSGLSYSPLASSTASAADAANARVPASQRTPSGFAVPRYVSLKYGEINGRTGPSQSHPVAWRYSRRGLPVIVVAETEMWRKVRDQSGDESWMHKRTLDGRRTVITMQEVVLRAKPRVAAKGKAIAAKDTLLTLDTCDATGWCKVKADTGHQGFVPKKTIWGATPL